MKRLMCGIMAAVMLLASGGIAAMATEGTETNLISNGSFETAVTSGGGWQAPNTGAWYTATDSGAENAVTEITEEQAHSGAQSIKLNHGAVSQRVSLSAGTYYLKLYVRAETGGTMNIGIYDGAREWPIDDRYMRCGSPGAVEIGDEWTEFYYGLPNAALHEFVVCVNTWDGSTIYVDDITLVKQDESDSFIANSNFSDGMTGWTESGDGSAMVNDGILTITSPENGTKVSQTISGLENGVYCLSAVAKTSNIDGIAYVYAKTAGHTMASTAIPQTEAEEYITVGNIIVEDGACEIGIYAKGTATVTADIFQLFFQYGEEPPFLKGGEISKLTYVEDMGGKFYRADGTEGDALQIMAENGFNLARIRLLDDPGRGHGEGDKYLPEGYMTEADCLNLARRAKDKGMHILFSVAYSDYWVDGERQYIPHKWQEEIAEQSLSGENMYKYLENKTYEYTKDIMQKLIEQGTCPEFVSIGNEIQLGMYFGSWKDSSPLYSNATYLARFLNAGARAVRETSPETKIVLHTDHAGAILDSKKNSEGKNIGARTIFTSAIANVDFDVIGVSYYPYYIDTVSIGDVLDEFNSMAIGLNKDVMVMETGYNWTQYTPYTYEGNKVLGQLHNSGYYQNIYGESQEGQRAFLTELYSTLKKTAAGRCLGVSYWDPVMIYVTDEYGNNKVGWAMKTDEWGEWTEDNVVPNSTIFDFDGKAVEGQLAMKYNTNSMDRINITGRVTDGTENITSTQITFNVNGSKYNVTTDKFGEYIVSVPYPADGELKISAKGCAEDYTKSAPTDGVLLSGINFDSYNIETEPDKFFVNGVSDLSGNLSFEVDYTDKVKNPVVFVAMYDTEGNLTGCKKGRSGSFDGAEEKVTYTLKAFLWNQSGEPQCYPAETQIEYK